MTNRSFFATFLIGLLLAAIIHIGILLFAPRLSVSDAWETLALPLEPFVAIPARPMMPTDFADDPSSEGEEEEIVTEVPMQDLDPQFSHAICRFHLRTGPVHLRSDGLEGFWTLNLFSAGGISFFSTNEQVNAGRPMNVLVTTPQQVASLRANNSASLDNLQVVETDLEDAAMLFRAYKQHEKSLPDELEKFQSILSCAPFQQS